MSLIIRLKVNASLIISPPLKSKRTNTDTTRQPRSFLERGIALRVDCTTKHTRALKMERETRAPSHVGLVSRRKLPFSRAFSSPAYSRGEHPRERWPTRKESSSLDASCENESPREWPPQRLSTVATTNNDERPYAKIRPSSRETSPHSRETSPRSRDPRHSKFREWKQWVRWNVCKKKKAVAIISNTPLLLRIGATPWPLKLLSPVQCTPL